MDEMQADSRVEETRFEAADGWKLAGTFTRAHREATGPAVLISSAAGAPRHYYAKFAQALVEAGASAVLTYDYRGMHGSKGDRSRWSELRMFHWGERDFPAAVAHLQAAAPGAPLVGLGHSYGGQALGLSPAWTAFDRYAAVGTLNGYWGGTDEPLRVWLQTQVIGRALAAIFPAIPEGLPSAGGMPSPIMRDWANWIRRKDYFFGLGDVPATRHFPNVTTPYLSVRLADDRWGTKRAVETFMAHYTAADMRHFVIEPGESGPIGHLGFFRSAHRSAHWPVLIDYLLKGTVPDEGVTSG